MSWRGETHEGARRSALRSVLGLAAALGVAASIFSVACSDDPVAPPEPPEADSGIDAPDMTPDVEAPPPKDAGADPDARGAYDPTEAQVVCDGSPCATQIVAGKNHFCARLNDGTVRCWGSDEYGVLGFRPGRPPDAGADAGDAGSRTYVIPQLADVTQISAAGTTNCARLDDGTVKCWGNNTMAQLGLRADRAVVDYNPHPTPAAVALDSEATRVDVGQGYACATLASGKLWCWGKDEYVQLLRPGGETNADYLRYREPGLADVGSIVVRQLGMSDHTVLALSASGEVWTWGAMGGDQGTIAGRIGSITPNPIPKRLETLGGVTSLAASPWMWEYSSGHRAHACALTKGEIYCWGRSPGGALGTGVPGEKREPAHAPFADTVKTWPQQLAAGDEITCARMTDGSVYCCGSDVRGRLGTGKLVQVSPFFIKASAFTRRAVQVATSDSAVCALVDDGSVECWGSNEKGELGLAADEDDHPSPVKIAF